MKEFFRKRSQIMKKMKIIFVVGKDLSLVEELSEIKFQCQMSSKWRKSFSAYLSMRPGAAITALPLVLTILGLAFNNPGIMKNDASASSSSFEYNFSVDGVLEQAKTSAESTSPYWWLRSGGIMPLSGGLGKTNQGEMPSSNRFRLNYAALAPLSTDNGYHPQNLFQLLTKSKWDSFQQEVKATVKRSNLSNSRNRNPWNGITLISRYADGNNHYTASIRMDGNAVIKKKKNGNYYVLASKKVLAGTYNKDSTPNLIPLNKQLGLMSKAVTQANGSVRLEMHLDSGSGWVKVAEATDNGSIGGSPLLNSGIAGIYSDFMDVELDNYKAIPLSASSSSVSPTPAPTPSTSSGPTATPAPTPSTSAGALFSDSFSQYPDGLITNEYAYWSPGAPGSKVSPVWEMTSGSLFAQGGAGWTGVPDAKAPNATSSTGNNSAIFRLTTKQSNFGNVAVTFDLLNQGLTSTSVTPAVDWDGIHVFLRYLSEEHLYYATVNRRDNTVYVKKKTPGGPSNGGTYVTLKMAPNTVPYGSWQKVKATVKNNTDGSVTIQLFVNDKLLLTAVDNGTIGGAPIRTSGKVGIRGDNANLKFKNFVVSPL